MPGKEEEKKPDRHHPGRAELRGFGYFRQIGPGVVTGAADDDPAGIGTYSQIGASFRYDLVWTAPLSLPLAAAVQETSARLGLTTGRGLMSFIKERMPALRRERGRDGRRAPDQFVGINPIRALFLSAILIGLAAPPLILLLLLLSRTARDPKERGGGLSTVIVAIALGVMTLAAVSYLGSLVLG